MARSDFFAAVPLMARNLLLNIPKIKPGPPKAHSFMNLQPHLKENWKLKGSSKIGSGSSAAQLETKDRTGPLADL